MLTELEDLGVNVGHESCRLALIVSLKVLLILRDDDDTRSPSGTLFGFVGSYIDCAFDLSVLQHGNACVWL